MIGYSTEVIDCICDSFSDDKELVVNILKYLHDNSKDYKMMYQIEEIFEDMKICPYYGNKLTYYEFEEPHCELDNNDIETIGVYMCNNCDKII